MAKALREFKAQQKLLRTANNSTPTSAEPSSPPIPLESQSAFIGIQSDVHFLKHDTIVTTDDLRKQIVSLEAEVRELQIWKRNFAAQIQKWKTDFEASTKLTTDTLYKNDAALTNGINILRSKVDRW
jgi:hypothetical protein